MIHIGASYNTSPFDRLTAAIRATPAVIQQVTAVQIVPVVESYMTQYIAVEPPPIAPGVFKRMATPKQFRYVMMKIRRKEWTGRTGRFIRAWRTYSAPLQHGAVVGIRNPSGVGTFISGPRQQSFHAHTGWVYAPGHVAPVQRLVRYVLVNALLRALIQQAKG